MWMTCLLMRSSTVHMLRSGSLIILQLRGFPFISHLWDTEVYIKHIEGKNNKYSIHPNTYNYNNDKFPLLRLQNHCRW